MGYRWKRVIKRLIFLFRLKEIITWEYESCDRCGKCYRLPYRMKDNIWLAVKGEEEGLLCFDCFIQTAEEKNIVLKLEDIESLWVFQNEGTDSFDVIEREEM